MSSFFEKIWGSGPYSEAREKIMEIQSRSRHPNGRERKELEAANQLLLGRRRFLVKSALLLGAAALGGKTLVDQIGSREPASSSVRVNSSPPPESAEPNREELAQGWTEPFAKMARVSSDPLAREVLRFVEENGILARPDLRGLRFIRAGKGSAWFALVNLTKDDVGISDAWANYYNGMRGAAAHFLPDQRTLLLKEYGNMSPAWKGLLFGHEAFHAYDYMGNPYDWKNSAEYLRHEVQAHEFESRLIRQEGKEGYQKVLGGQVAHLAKINGGIGPEGALSALPLSYAVELDQVFGPAESKFEIDLRATHTNIDATFDYIEKTSPRDQQMERKMGYLRQMYQGNEGVLK